MRISRFVIELTAAQFGKKSLSARALERAKDLGGECTFILENNHFTVVRS